MDIHHFSRTYLKYLEENLSGLNLTRITSYDDFLVKQVVDSIKPFEDYNQLLDLVNSLSLFVDIGFGGGFPILPLREFFGEKIKMIGIDSRRKKVDAVRLISKFLNQKNILFFHDRIEKLTFDKPAFFTLKAVGEINKFLQLINCEPGSYVMFYKGPGLKEQEPNYKKNIGYEFISEYEINISNITRVVVLFKKISRNKTDNSLVKLSDFVFN